MFDKLDFITGKYDELAQKVSDPEIINNQPVVAEICQGDGRDRAYRKKIQGIQEGQG